MRKTVHTIATLALVSLSFQCPAQSQRNMKEQIEASRKALKAKSDKAAVKEAKRMAKEGWKPTPGALPLEKQLDKSYNLEYQSDEYGFPLFVFGRATSTGGNFDAAKMQALELAKLDLAGNIQTEVEALIVNNIGNKLMNHGDVASVTKSVAGSKNRISQSIGRFIPLVEAYRETYDGNKEVTVRIAYNMTMAKMAAKDAIIKDMEEHGDSLISQLDQILDW